MKDIGFWQAGYQRLSRRQVKNIVNSALVAADIEMNCLRA